MLRCGFPKLLDDEPMERGGVRDGGEAKRPRTRDMTDVSDSAPPLRQRTSAENK